MRTGHTGAPEGYQTGNGCQSCQRFHYSSPYTIIASFDCCANMSRGKRIVTQEKWR
jgi:hypothetical protein